MGDDGDDGVGVEQQQDEVEKGGGGGEEEELQTFRCSIPIPFDKQSTNHFFKQRIINSEIDAIAEYSEKQKVSNIFQGVRVYFDGHTDSVSLLHLKRLVLMHSGTYSHYFSPSSCTHVIASILSIPKIQQITNSRNKITTSRSRRKKKASSSSSSSPSSTTTTPPTSAVINTHLHYVHPDWILDSCSKLMKLDESLYSLISNNTNYGLKENVSKLSSSNTSPSNDIRSFFKKIDNNNNEDKNQQIIDGRKKRDYKLEDYSGMSEFELVQYLKKIKYSKDLTTKQQQQQNEEEQEFEEDIDGEEEEAEEIGDINNNYVDGSNGSSLPKSLPINGSLLEEAEMEYLYKARHSALDYVHLNKNKNIDNSNSHVSTSLKLDFNEYSQSLLKQLPRGQDKKSF